MPPRRPHSGHFVHYQQNKSQIETFQTDTPSSLKPALPPSTSFLDVNIDPEISRTYEPPHFKRRLQQQQQQHGTGHGGAAGGRGKQGGGFGRGGRAGGWRCRERESSGGLGVTTPVGTGTVSSRRDEGDGRGESAAGVKKQQEEGEEDDGGWGNPEPKKKEGETADEGAGWGIGPDPKRPSRPALDSEEPNPWGIDTYELTELEIRTQQWVDQLHLALSDQHDVETLLPEGFVLEPIPVPSDNMDEEVGAGWDL